MKVVEMEMTTTTMMMANELYKRTGQLPQEQTDFRTTEEKLADILALRVEARTLLAGIADPQNANKIAQDMTSQQVSFYVQNYQYHHNIRNTTLHTIFHVLFLFICLNFSNKSKIKCATNAAAISGGMSHTMFPVIFVSILLYNLQKMFFSTFQQISMSNSHRTSCEFLKDIFGRISGANSGARWSPSRII